MKNTVIIIGIVVLTAIISALPVMLLWNWLMTEIFGLCTITFWQAWGLSILCGTLFKSNNTNASN